MLLHLPVGLSSHQTAQRRLSGAHNDRSQSHRQWLAVTAPAGRAHAVERVEATCRREPRCCQTKQVPKKGVEGRRRDARRRPKKLRFISRGKKALAHPSLLPLTYGSGSGWAASCPLGCGCGCKCSICLYPSNSVCARGYRRTADEVEDCVPESLRTPTRCFGSA